MTSVPGQFRPISSAILRVHLGVTGGAGASTTTLYQYHRLAMGFDVARRTQPDGGVGGQCRFLTRIVAGVAIWERPWKRHGDDNADWFTCEASQTPHHSPWCRLSFGHWSELDTSTNRQTGVLTGA